MLRIGLVGCGRMGAAMLRGWGAATLDMHLSVFDPAVSPEIAGFIGARGWLLNPDPATAAAPDVVVLAVKPQSFQQVAESTLRQICGPGSLAVSIMAGVTLERLKAACASDRVVRAMPNTPGQIGRGITAYVAAPAVSAADRTLVEQLLQPLGDVVGLSVERQMDAVTAVSGSGPAYLFLLTEALAAAGEGEGLERSVAERLARETMIGSAALMDQSDQTPHELRKEVTSPGGTTAAALDVLTGGGGVISLMRRAIEAAAARSRQLGKQTA